MRVNTLVRVVAAAALVAACGGEKIVGPPPAAVPTQLSMATQPSAAAQNAAPLATPPSVRLRDANGIVVAKSGVVVTATSSGTATLTNATATTAANGTATFSGLTLTGVIGSYTLTFSATSLTAVSSNAIALAAGAASQLAVTTQPAGTSQAGVVLAQQPVVQLRDVSGNDAAQAGVTVTATLVSGTVTVGNAAAVTNASGSASFAGLTLSGSVGSYTLRFTAPGMTQADAAAPIALTAGPATQLALATAPSASAANGAVLVVQPVVQLRDAFGNDALQAGVVVVASVVSGPAGSVIAGDSITTTASGTATFTGLRLTGLAGSYGLRFASTGLSSIIGATALTAGAATKLGLTTAPTNSPQSGIAFPIQPVVQIQDTSGNAVPQAGLVVRATVTGATLTNDSATTDAAGKATFSGLTLSGSSTIYILTFTAPGVTAVTSAPIGLNPGPASQLVLATQPSFAAQSGVNLTTQPVVRLQDGAGNVVGQANVVVTVTAVSGTVTLGSAAVNTTAGGTATFTALKLTGTIGSYTLRFSAPGVTSVDASSPTVLSAGPAALLSLTTEPTSSAQSGVALATQPVVQVRDASSNTVALAGVVVTATAAGATVTNGTATTNASGVASFAGLALSGPANANYRLIFNAPGLVNVNAAIQTTLSPGAPATISLLTAPPLTAVNNVAFSVTPQIQVLDDAGNGVPNQVVHADAAGATVTNGSATTDASGLASFPGLTLTGQVSGYSLRFCTGSDCNSTLAIVVSPTPTALAAGAAALMSVTTQPGAAAQNGVALAAQPAVHVTDVAGNPVAGATVTATAGAAGVAGGTAISDAAGDATFSALTLSGSAGNYTLLFATTGASAPAAAATALSAGSAAFISVNVQPSATATNGLVLAQQPVVTVTDGSGNPVPGVVVTASTAAGVSVANPSAATNGSGVATFAGLALTGIANPYTLTFTSGAASQNAGVATVLTAGGAVVLSFTTPPPAGAQSGVAFTTTPVVHVTDGTNPLAGIAVTASVTGGTLSNATAVSNGAGNATFTGLTLAATAPASYTVAFTAGAATPLTSAAINLAAGPATTLVVVAAPSATVQNAVALAAQPAVRLVDAGGNTVAQAGTTITASVVGGGVTVGNATAVTAGTGTATFSGLSLTGLVGSYTLRFSGPSLASVNAGAATAVTVGAAASLALTTQPAFAAIVGQLLPRQPQVQVQDVSGNAVSQAGINVTVTTDSLPASLQGTRTVATTGAGSATFTNLVVNAPGGHRLFRFTSGALTAASASDTSLIAALVTSGTPVTSNGMVNSESPYAIIVPPGADSLVVTISDPTLTQTADLYVRFGAAPEPFGGPQGTGLYDCFPSNSGANETCKMVLPAAGTWYVVVRAFPFSFANVTLTARVY